MIILVKIALRNIAANRKRSALIGLAIFISSFLLLILDSSANGLKKQMLRRYINTQSGDVIIFWENVKKISNDDLYRINFFDNSKSFDVDKDFQNKSAIKNLNKFLKDNSGDIRHNFPTINRSGANMLANNMMEGIIIYSLTGDGANFLVDSGTLIMEKGVPLSGRQYGICISRARADKCSLDTGDSVSVEATTPYGAMNMLEFLVTGIYSNVTGFEYFSFVSYEAAVELFDFDSGYFDAIRIYLKDPDNASEFAEKLDRYLLNSGGVLRSEPYSEASTFWTSYSDTMKLYINIFILIILIMVAVGLRVTIKMNLFDRMKEFGTIRAIGFSRVQSYMIIFLEIFFLSVICLFLGILLSGIFAGVFGRIGIYTGREASYLLSGDRLFPRMVFSDVFFTFIILTFFSVFSTFNPGMKICYQKIIDLLLKKQRKVYLIGIFVRKIFRIAAFR